MSFRCGGRCCAGMRRPGVERGHGLGGGDRSCHARPGSFRSSRGRAPMVGADWHRDPDDLGGRSTLRGAGAYRAHGGPGAGSWESRAERARGPLPSSDWQDALGSGAQIRALPVPDRLDLDCRHCRDDSQMMGGTLVRRTNSRHVPHWTCRPIGGARRTSMRTNALPRSLHPLSGVGMPSCSRLFCLLRRGVRTARTAHAQYGRPSFGHCCAGPSCRSRARRSARLWVPSWLSRFVSSRWVRLDAASADEDLPLKCP